MCTCVVTPQWTFHTHSSSEDSSQEQSSSPPPEKYLSFNEAMRPWAPFVVMSILYSAWVYLSPTEIIEKEPRIFFFSMGILFSNISVSSFTVLLEFLKYITIATSSSILLPENSYSTCHYEASSDLICLHIDTLSHL